MTKYVTDDPYTSQVIIQFAVNRGMMQIVTKDGKTQYDFDETKVDEIIERGIREGFFKVHLELGEWYYHPTFSGLALLKCKCCGNERFEDDECLNPPLTHEQPMVSEQ